MFLKKNSAKLQSFLFISYLCVNYRKGCLLYVKKETWEEARLIVL